jgi:(1->4)-alpha-D-glucan 1-alpha-D-glucosylmutase
MPPLAEWRSGALKREMIARVLEYRRDTPELFVDGRYVPVAVEGPNAAHVVAFLRTHGRRRILAVAVRLPGALLAGADTPTISPAVWETTHLALPTMIRGRELVTRRDLDGTVTLAMLFAHLPVALLALG